MHQQASSLEETLTRSCRPYDYTPPYPPEGHFDKYTSLELTDNPFMIMVRIGEYLTKNNIHHETRWDKFKMKCSAIIDQERIPFIIRIFATYQSGTYQAEFQRRSGCTIKFQGLYRRLVSELLKSPLDKPIYDITPNVIKLEDDTLHHLYQMIESECVDVKVQAMRLLALCGSQVDHRHIPKIVSICIRAITSHYSKRQGLSTDIIRCSLVCLVSMANLNINEVMTQLQLSDISRGMFTHHKDICTEIDRLKSITGLL